MALLSKIYFNAVFGALGGLLGWMLYGVFGEKLPSGERAFLFLTEQQLQWLFAGAIIGGIIGFFVVSVEAIRDQSLVRFARLGAYGVILGGVGGSIGAYIGVFVQAVVVGLGDNVLITMLAFALGWLLLGLFIGMSEGIAARSLGKFSYGTIGGAIGGFVGGSLYGMFLWVANRTLTPVHFWQGLGLVILGACIGSLSALVQAVFQPACVRVLRGWQEGREYPLDKPENLLGRDEHADIALFRDMKVEKRHCFIKRKDNKYVLVNNNAPAEQTLVNERPVGQMCELQDGDRIQLGNVVLRFQMRAAANRVKKRPLPLPAGAPLPTAVPATGIQVRPGG
jgi:hypothetical protein